MTLVGIAYFANNLLISFDELNHIYGLIELIIPVEKVETSGKRNDEDCVIKIDG